ncbi:MAG: phosphodiester glycosidase family protein [Treponemataceae bacterium]|nr:MAG: phosphodiester glycosidase family protein [Treponemataceae bacterium]
MKKAKKIRLAFLTALFVCSLAACLTANVENLEEFAPEWESFSEGVDYFSAVIANPHLQIWAFRVNIQKMQKSGQKFVVSPLAKAGVISGTTVSDFAKQYGCSFALNANPFTPVSAKKGEERDILGVVVSNGELLSSPNTEYDAFVVMNDGSASIVNQGKIKKSIDSETKKPKGVFFAVGGFYRVLENGKIAAEVAARADVRHPRSAIGTSSDGSTAYFVVVDGRRMGSVGVTETELAFLLQKLGAYDALNLDGGGSSALSVRFPAKDKLQLVNKPVHNRIPGWERVVATCIGISASAE